MTTSPVALALADSAKVDYGFWYSHGTSLPRGPMLTLNSFWFTFISSCITLYLAWALSRIWRISSVLIFHSIFEKTKHSLQESQCASLIVNCNSPLEALFDSVSIIWRNGPRGTLRKILGAALVIVGVKAAIPALLAAFPAYNIGIIASEPTTCGLFATLNPGAVNASNYWEAAARISTDTIRWADAALTLNDQNSNNSPNPRGRVSRSSERLPIPIQSYVTACPPTAICNTDLPFTFSSKYTLHPQHFSLNTKIPFSLQISDTCYRPLQAMVRLSPPSSRYTRYGLFYGPTNFVNVAADVPSNEYTELVYEERKLSPGYTLKSHSARAGDPTSERIWRPNTSLALGGDTTILFYFIGDSFTPKRSLDPIFATRESGIQTAVGVVYESAYIVSPIVCDTKYRICANGDRDCSPPGGYFKVNEWLGRKSGEGWKDLKTFFMLSLLDPPISLPAIGSGAVAASKTAPAGGIGQIQLDSGNATARRELARLTQAGMTMLASGSQLAALGYWRGIAGIKSTSIGSLCNNVLIESPNTVSVLLTPYIALLGLATIIIIVSYAKHLGVQAFRRWREWADLWALHYTGQLHREVVERVYSRFARVDATQKWPTMGAVDSAGLDVVMDENGSKRLGPGTFVMGETIETTSIERPANSLSSTSK